jgi:hypothetical protein
VRSRRRGIRLRCAILLAILFAVPMQSADPAAVVSFHQSAPPDVGAAIEPESS